MSLTMIEARNAQPKETRYRLFDERGLYLEVDPSGSKWWRLKYRYNGKEKRLSLGIFSETGLKEARDRRDAARKLVAEGVDPIEHRKIMKAATIDRAENSFEIVAREWFAKNLLKWNESHGSRIIRRLERD